MPPHPQPLKKTSVYSVPSVFKNPTPATSACPAFSALKIPPQ